MKTTEERNQTDAIWLWPSAIDATLQAKLCAELSISPLTADVLIRRGFDTPEAAYAFLNPTLDQLHDPRLLPDFEPACRAILAAREAGDIIAIHGDYDVDGVTSTSLLTRFLRRIGCKVTPHVPHRIKEGYGIHLTAVEWAVKEGAKVFLTCDCGIKAHEQIREVRAAGMIPLVTDHHQVGDSLPDAEAIVNPHRADSDYPFAELSGVGVVLKLCAGITEELGHKSRDFYRAYLDLATLGTVADVMPLEGENRVIVALGLPELRQSKKAGIVALKEVSDLAEAPTLVTSDIGFRLGPRINAVGRIDDASIALDLLLTDNLTEARNIAKRLDDVNQERKEMQAKALEGAIESVLAQGLHERNVIFVHSKEWHSGLVGIVAGKLVERFRRPSFVGSESNGTIKASGRSIPGFDLGEAIRRFEGVHEGGGGHELAAGLAVRADRVDELSQLFDEMGAEVLKPEDFIPKVVIDANAETSDCTMTRLQELKRLEPFGNCNPEPVFGLKAVRITDVVPTSKPEHVRIQFSDGRSTVSAMAFGMGETIAQMDTSREVDLAVTISENWFRGTAKLQVTVKAISGTGQNG